MLQSLKSKVFDEANILMDHETLCSLHSVKRSSGWWYTPGDSVWSFIFVPPPSIHHGRPTVCALNFCWINWMKKWISTSLWNEWNESKHESQPKSAFGESLNPALSPEPFRGITEDDGEGLKEIRSPLSVPRSSKEEKPHIPLCASPPPPPHLCHASVPSFSLPGTLNRLL